MRQLINLWLVGTLIGLALDWQVTVVLSGLSLIVALGGATAYGIQRFRRFWAHSHTVTPMAEGLAEVTGLAAQEAESRLALVNGYRKLELGKVGRYRLPGHFTGSDGGQKQVEAVIRSRLPQAIEFKWNLHGGKGGYVDFYVAPKLPKMVRLLDHVREIEALPPRAYIGGATTSGLYTAKFVGPEPHHGYCWGTSVGKSTQMASILAQIKHNEPDATATIIDPKETSLAFMKGIPGFEFWDDPTEFDTRVEGMTQDNYLHHMPGMWKGVYGTYQLMNERRVLVAEDRTREFPTHLFVFEEANSFSLMSKTWWTRNRPKGAPVQPPVWADWIAPLFWRARAYNIYIILAAQSIQERFLGNLNLRPSLGLVSLAKFKPSHYENYIGTTPVPKMQKGQGRALFNDGEVDTWVQCLYASEEEFRAFALAGMSRERDRVSV